jgi:hypothetical protein
MQYNQLLLKEVKMLGMTSLFFYTGKHSRATSKLTFFSSMRIFLFGFWQA